MGGGDGEILFARFGARAQVTLNRPAVLNAISHDMLLRLEERLRAWAADESVALVAITGAGGRAFAAGGDIRRLHADGRRDPRRTHRFYADEYRVNTLVKRFPKPYVAVIDGIVMGGGVGLSVHGSHRIVGPGTRFAMPETGIGLFPDVGASWFLPRLPGALGLYLGLTGARLGAAECIECGLAGLHIPPPALAAALAALDRVEPDADRGRLDAEVTRRLAAFAGPPAGPGRLAALRPAIDRCFPAPDLAAILDRLAGEAGEWAARTRRELTGKSPTSLHLAFRALRAGARLSFEDCMRMEYRLARACMQGPDFYEGVRAFILDKDGAPEWNPATLAAVDPAVIDRAFAPLGPGELALPAPPFPAAT